MQAIDNINLMSAAGWTFLLFDATALAEIVGCYLPHLWLRQDRSAWLLLPAAACPTTTDWVGVAVCLVGMAIIMFGRRSA